MKDLQLLWQQGLADLEPRVLEWAREMDAEDARRDGDRNGGSRGR